MPRRVAMCAAIALVGAATALAQRPAPPFLPSRNNAERLRWFDYKMVAGRIVAGSRYPPGMNISFGPSEAAGRRERLQLLTLQDQASVQYELEDDGRELVISLAQDGGLSVRYARDEPKLAMEFLQPPGAPVSLLVIERGVVRRLEGESFWHLYIADPDLVRRHLIPYLELLRPSWQLAATGWAIEEALMLRAQNPRALDTDRWSRLVDELASPEFSARERAQRELLEIGQIVLPFLEGLDRGRLDAEQAARIGALVDTLSVGYEDTSARIATWLVADEQTWLSMLSRDEEVKRRVAAGQLAAIMGRAIDFDPAADPATRQAHLEKLRSRLATAREQARRKGGAGDDVSSVPPPGIER